MDITVLELAAQYNTCHVVRPSMLNDAAKIPYAM